MKGVHEMQEDRKPEVLKRLSYIEGHVAGIRKMVEEDKYCIDILRQTHAVRKALEKLEGVNSVKVDIPSKTVDINYDPEKVTLTKIEEVLDDVGYTVAK